jgi:DHA1 family tetracycline resistance protein-like MFS transporter
MIGAAFGIGFTFGPLVGAGCIAWNSSLALPGYMAAVLSAAAFLLAVTRLPETRSLRSGTAPKRSWLNVTQIARHLSVPSLSMTLLAIFITTFGFAQFESTLSLLTKRLGYDLKWNFLLYSYVGFVLTLGQGLLVRRLLPSVGEKRMAVAGSVLMALGFVLVGGAGAGWRVLPPASVWFILPVIVIGFSAVTPSLQSLLSLATGSDEQGSVLGTGQSLSSLARIFGPYLGIRLLGYSTALPYFLGAGLIAFGGILVLMIRPTVPLTAEQPAVAAD